MSDIDDFSQIENELNDIDEEMYDTQADINKKDSPEKRPVKRRVVHDLS